MARRDKINYYLDIAETVAERGTCLRRNFGAVIVKNDQIISTGYAGAPRGRQNCIDRGNCLRNELSIPRGERYEICRSVHAEVNAIISAARSEIIGGTLYLVGVEHESREFVKDADCCSMCKRVIINSGVRTVIIRMAKDEFRTVEVSSWVENDDDLKGKLGY